MSISRLGSQLIELISLISLWRLRRVFTGMMRFHALQSMNKQRSSLEIQLSYLCNYRALYSASRPESMPHRTPWVIRVCAIVSFAIFPNLESWSGPADGQVDNTCLVRSRFDCIFVSFFVECDGAAIGVERRLGIIEAWVIEGIRTPQVRSLFVRVVNFRVELACSPDPTVCIEECQYTYQFAPFLCDLTLHYCRLPGPCP